MKCQDLEFEKLLIAEAVGLAIHGLDLVDGALSLPGGGGRSGREFMPRRRFSGLIRVQRRTIPVLGLGIARLRVVGWMRAIANEHGGKTTKIALPPCIRLSR